MLQLKYYFSGDKEKINLCKINKDLIKNEQALNELLKNESNIRDKCKDLSLSDADKRLATKARKKYETMKASLLKERKILEEKKSTALKESQLKVELKQKRIQESLQREADNRERVKEAVFNKIRLKEINSESYEAQQFRNKLDVCIKYENFINSKASNKNNKQK